MRFARLLVGNAGNAVELLFEIGIRSLFDLSGDFSIRRTAMWRIVFVTTIFRRIVGRRGNNAVCETLGPSTIVCQDGMRNHGSWRVATAIVDHDVDPIGREHLNSTDKRGLGERMGIDS